jgi:hypothetical protein
MSRSENLFFRSKPCTGWSTVCRASSLASHSAVGALVGSAATRIAVHSVDTRCRPGGGGFWHTSGRRLTCGALCAGSPRTRRKEEAMLKVKGTDETSNHGRTACSSGMYSCGYLIRSVGRARCISALSLRIPAAKRFAWLGRKSNPEKDRLSGSPSQGLSPIKRVSATERIVPGIVARRGPVFCAVET